VGDVVGEAARRPLPPVNEAAERVGAFLEVGRLPVGLDREDVSVLVRFALGAVSGLVVSRDGYFADGGSR
jgi:hypothetical protein